MPMVKVRLKYLTNYEYGGPDPGISPLRPRNPALSKTVRPPDHTPFGREGEHRLLGSSSPFVIKPRWHAMRRLVIVAAASFGPHRNNSGERQMPRRLGAKRFHLAAALAAALLAGAAQAMAASTGLDQIDHIVVIYLENHSFDNLYGRFPGAEGLAKAGAAALQRDKDGKPYALLPPVIDVGLKPPSPDPRFPKDLPNGPFAIDKFVPIDQKTGDIVHRFYQEQAQIDGGKMDKFVAYSDAAALVMGNYDIGRTKLWALARRYALADNFFHGTFGGSFLNHIWLVCACAPRYPEAPPELVARLDAGGNLMKDGAVTPDGFAVNTIYSSSAPHPASIKDPRLLLAPLAGFTTIGDQLSEKGIGWAWYSGGWDDALAGHPDPLFQFHHQPFAYFKQFADGTAAKREHLQDEKAMIAAIVANRLPAVAFWKPLGDENQHPGYAELTKGDDKVAQVIEMIRRSPIWPHAAIIVTYDENGGYWDHVAPPKLDRWGPGSRVPTIILSPFARRGFVDHTLYDTTSILKFIEARYRLPQVNAGREAKVGDLTAAFKF
jgi:acid phosphatase